MNPYFSVNQANEILPTVIKKFNYAKKMKVEVMKMEQQLTGLTPTTSLEEYTTIKKKLNSLVTKFYQSIEDLESTGVLLKGLDEGLLDFTAKARIIPIITPSVATKYMPITVPIIKKAIPAAYT